MRALLLTCAALIAAPAHAETIAITGGMIAIGDGSAPAKGTVVIRDGRVVGAGSSIVVPAGARTVDATGKWVSTVPLAGALPSPMAIIPPVIAMVSA